VQAQDHHDSDDQELREFVVGDSRGLGNLADPAVHFRNDVHDQEANEKSGEQKSNHDQASFAHSVCPKNIYEGFFKVVQKGMSNKGNPLCTFFGQRNRNRLKGVTLWERLLHRKKAEFYIRLSRAALTLQPGENASLLDRILYRNLSKASHWFFLKLAEHEVAIERIKMAQEDCKHDKAAVDATFCPECGKQLGADPEVEAAIGRTVRKILSEYDVKPKATPKKKEGTGSETPKSLAEKLGLNKEKK
jgi:hypothetical protein